ncbi:MAG: biotin transporter BioY [Bradyrhizobium sp.]|nr:MAG: biotin transporter BioY [Bradyrhizobium sp.]
MIDRSQAASAAALKSAGVSRLASGYGLALAGTLVLTVSAKIQVPFYPVPMTLQTLAVLTLAALMGARLATGMVALYLLEGVTGLPVFAGAVAGPAYMAGPTGGYLVGFLLCAALVGWLADRGWTRGWLLALAAMTLGHFVIFAAGFTWLAYGLALGAGKAWAGGVMPFWAATAAKTVLAAALVIAARRVNLSRSAR